MMFFLPFDSSQHISSGLALLFVMVLSVAIGWLSVSVSDEIVQNVKSSSLVNINERPAMETRARP